MKPFLVEIGLQGAQEGKYLEIFPISKIQIFAILPKNLKNQSPHASCAIQCSAEFPVEIVMNNKKSTLYVRYNTQYSQNVSCRP